MMINHRIFERWFLCERFIFQRQLAYCVLRWRLSLILIIISFRFLKFWNGSFTLYIQIYIFVFIFCCYMHTLLYCIMCCNSLFSLRLCTYILYMMCTVYDILFEWLFIWKKVGFKYKFDLYAHEIEDRRAYCFCPICHSVLLSET